jgi:hypothetical protein
LTVAQQNAVDLLATGKTDTEVSELLDVNRVTVTHWRCYDPLFQAELNRRRTEIWASGIHKLPGSLVMGNTGGPKRDFLLADLVAASGNYVPIT